MSLLCRGFHVFKKELLIIMVPAQQERIQVFLIGRGGGGGGPNFGLERTVELFCGKSLESKKKNNSASEKVIYDPVSVRI